MTKYSGRDATIVGLCNACKVTNLFGTKAESIYEQDPVDNVSTLSIAYFDLSYKIVSQWESQEVKVEYQLKGGSMVKKSFFEWHRVIDDLQASLFATREMQKEGFFEETKWT